MRLDSTKSFYYKYVISNEYLRLEQATWQGRLQAEEVKQTDRWGGVWYRLHNNKYSILDEEGKVKVLLMFLSLNYLQIYPTRIVFSLKNMTSFFLNLYYSFHYLNTLCLQQLLFLKMSAYLSIGESRFIHKRNIRFHTGKFNNFIANSVQ